MKRKTFNEAEAEAAHHRRVEGTRETAPPRRKRLPMLPPQAAPPPLSPLFRKFIEDNGLQDMLEEDHPDLESKA